MPQLNEFSWLSYVLNLFLLMIATLFLIKYVSKLNLNMKYSLKLPFFNLILT